jgi:O-antigen/teichoic acid export membrane protein
VAAIVLSNTLVFETQLILGLAFLGYIRVATNLGERIDKAEHVLAAVMFPVLSRSRDAGFKRRAYEATSKLILVWAVPTGIGLAVFSDDIVRHVLGAQWRAITPLLWVEGIGEVFNAIATMWSMFYMVEGDNRPTMWVGLSTNILLVALIAALAPVLHYAGVVVALSVVIVVSLFQRRYFLLRLLPGAPVIKPALPFLLAGTVAGGCALVLRSQGLGNSLGLALRVAVYLAIYLGIVLLLQRGFLRQSMATLRGNSGR